MKRFMHVLPSLLGWVVFIGLGGCSTLNNKPQLTVPVNWQQQQKKAMQLEHWRIKGRISVQSEYEGGQVDYVWRQRNKTDYDIRLQAPMGAGTTLINARENGINLKTSSGVALFDTDIDQLILRLNGWSLPISGLQYWVRGIPAPGRDYKVEQWSQQGVPFVMLQDGWRIEFKKYKALFGQILPGKLFINRITGDEVDVRLIIRQWDLL